MTATEILKSFSKVQIGLTALASAISLAGGAAAGCAIAMKKLEAKYAEISDREIAEAKQFYSRLYKKEEFATPGDAVRALISEDGENTSDKIGEVADLLLAYQGHATPVMSQSSPENFVEVARNVFTDANPYEFDYEKELELRDPDKPYVITQEEYDTAEFDYDQVEFTYFEEDGVLSNERDQEVPDAEATVGMDNLTRFGHGSNDQNVVYVRNVRLGLDFTILRSTGSYAREVAGFGEDASLEHSYKRSLRRFREADD